MKKILLPLLVSLSIYANAQQKAEIAFVVKEKDLIPEGIAYDPATKAFFLSSIYKNKIVKIPEKGQVSDFVSTGQDGILQVLGMKVDHEGNLWACNNSPEEDTLNRVANVHVFNIKTGKLLKKFTLKDGTKHLFNDLYFMKNGDTYLTDSEGRTVYLIKNKSENLEVFLPPGSLEYPNGITALVDETKLLVATGSGLGIVSIDITSKKIQPVSHPKFLLIGMDGLYGYKNSLVAVQNVTYPEAILRFELSENGENFTSVKSLSSDLPEFDSPTTGAIAGDHFYWIANSQLFQLIGNQGKIKAPEKLKETMIMKIKLN